MRMPIADDQVAEVLVKGEQDALVRVGIGKDGFIAGVYGPVLHRFNVVACPAQFADTRRPERGVDQQVHASVLMYLGAKRSPATARYA